MSELLQEQYCQVVLRDAVRQYDREYTYAVPAGLSGLIEAGFLVEVPFGPQNRMEPAYVLSVHAAQKADFFIKPIHKPLADRPVLTLDQIRLAVWMRQRYLCTYGASFRCMTPQSVLATRDKTVRYTELIDEQDTVARLSAGEIDRVGHVRVLEMLLDYGSAPVHEVCAACQVTPAVLKTLEKKELLRFFRQEVRREPTDAPEEVVPSSAFIPNAEQAEAIRRIIEAMADAGQPSSGREYLLYGITGSGKTEVYLQAAHQALKDGKSVLILVPEISLTPQMIGRIRSRFGEDVAVLHSRLTPSERYEQWQRILRKEVRLVAGARSAVFAPLENIGLIIIDEEQESTYKSETHPRYHAREIARMRTGMHSAVLVLGSATPSVESYYQKQSGQSHLLELPERIGSAGLPSTRIIDMREELRNGNRSIFSRSLQEAVSRAHRNGQQSMIFINRRGYSGFVLCRACGQVIKCSACSVSLTTHLGQGLHAENPVPTADSYRLICHYCGRISRMPSRCPLCGSNQIGRFGAGTQQVEELFGREFPALRTLRMDQDTTAGRRSHAQLLSRFAAHEADVLIGTQMIAKGHDFPNVTVVGVLAADQLLGMSDFRASERAFQLILQAAGRAGRGDMPGEVIIQAYNTDDYAIQAAAKQDYHAFYEQEIAFRKMQHYPPFGSIGLIILAGEREERVQETIEKLHRRILTWQNEHGDFPAVTVSEPARAPLHKIRGRFRWRMVLQAESPMILAGLLSGVTERFDFNRLSVTIDVDPWQML